MVLPSRTFSVVLALLAIALPLGAAKPPVDKECQERFETLKEAYEVKKTAPFEERLPLLLELSKAPCKETVDYLASYYAVADEPGMHLAVTQALGRMGTKDAMEAIVVTGAKAMEKDVFAMDSLVSALQGRWDDAAESWFLKTGQKAAELRTHPEVWRGIVVAMSRFRSKDRIKTLIQSLRDEKEAAVQVAILESLEGNGDSRVISAVKKLIGSSAAEVEVAAFHCLVAQSPEKHRADFGRGIRSKHWQVRVVCLRALAALGDPKLVEHAKKLLEDPEVRVQVVAVQSLLRFGGKDAVAALVARMPQADGRFLDDLADALARLTGRNLGANAISWESWWTQYKDAPGEYRGLGPEAFSALIAGKQNQQTLLYHGLRVISKRVAFIYDSSDSMNEVYVPVGERDDGKRTLTDAQAAEAKRKKEKTRMDVASAELEQVIRGLGKDKSFDVISFDSVIKDFIQDSLGKEPQRLEPVTEATRSAAIDFVKAAKPAGLTSMLKAFKTAFEYQDLDTIYLLSDGAPTPESGSMEDILKFVRRENRLRNVRINAIGFDLEEDERLFLRTLAEENFGVFLER